MLLRTRLFAKRFFFSKMKQPYCKRIPRARIEFMTFLARLTLYNGFAQCCISYIVNKRRVYCRENITHKTDLDLTKNIGNTVVRTRVRPEKLIKLKSADQNVDKIADHNADHNADQNTENLPACSRTTKILAHRFLK